MKQALFGLVFASAVIFRPPSGEQAVQRSAVHGVRITVSVQANGRPVTGLGPANFEVVDEGVRQAIDSVTAPGHLAVALVLDGSLSVRVAGFERALASAGRLVQALATGDRAAVVGFSNRTAILASLTQDKEKMAAGIRAAGMLTSGALPRSVVWDSVVGATSLLSDDSAMPVVVLFSDGMDNASWLSQGQATEILGRLGVALHFIGIPWDNASYDFFPPGRNAPEELALDTGGVALSLDDRDLDQRLRARLDEARHSYVLTYSPTGVRVGDGWHDLTVRVRGQAGAVRTRRGYWSTVPPVTGRPR